MSEVGRVVAMIEDGSAELQCAAAMVLGELKAKEARPALLKALKSENETLRLYAVEALGKIDAKEAAPHLVPLLASPGRLRGRIQQVLMSVGEAVVPMLQKQIEKASPDVRSAILEVLGQFKSVDLSQTMFHALGDKNPDVVRQAAEGLKTRFSSLAGDARLQAVKQVTLFMGRKLSSAAATAGIRLLSELKDPSSVRMLMGFLDRKNEPAVRTAALEAMAHQDLAREAARVVPRLLGMLEEEAYVSPALAVLGKLRVPKEHAERLLKLLASPLAAVRLFAIQGLGTVGGPAAAAGLISGLFSSDRRVADEAERALQGNASFAAPLLRALQSEQEPARALRLSNVLRAHREAIDAGTAKSLIAKCLRLQETRSPVAPIYGEILRSVAPAPYRDAVVKRGRELMKKRKLDDAERVLRLVARDDLATGESDFALAAVLLVTLKKDLATARLDRSQAVALFSKLIKRAEFPVLKELERDAKSLGAPSLLYLGFVLVERSGPERDFGAQVLKLVAKKFGRAKEAATAKAKLKTQGAT